MSYFFLNRVYWYVYLSHQEYITGRKAGTGVGSPAWNNRDGYQKLKIFSLYAYER